MIAAVVTLLAMASCSKDNETELPPMNPDFITTTEVTFEGLAEDQENTIRFTSPAAWTAEVHSTASWLKADRTSGGAGEAVITLSPRTDNFGLTSREATLEIFIDGYTAYVVKVYQKSAATGDIQVSGHIDNGVMTLKGDATGTSFRDTIYVTSTRQWTLAADAENISTLTFLTGAEQQNGNEKTVMVIVTADYSKFTTSSFEGKFLIRTGDGNAVPITVKAQAETSVYDSERQMQGEQERLTYQLVDSTQHGVYATRFYVESNVRWSIKDKPSWIETSADWSGDASSAPSNLQKDGTITVGRRLVALRVKDSAVSADGKTGDVNIVDARGTVLKTLHLIFAGAGSNFIQHTLSFPTDDNHGNPFAFEANEATVDNTSTDDNRRQIARPFNVRTFVDYSSIADAPYHLILIDATNGIAHKKEVHWAHLKMGDPSHNTVGANGMRTKQIILEANNRGDADDKNGLTKPSEIRRAFVFLVPRSVTFESMWNEYDVLKPEYADQLVLLSQKNDPNADYKFGFDDLADGSLINVPAAGGAYTYHVTEGSYAKCQFLVEKKNSDGTWSRDMDNSCNITFTTNDNDEPVTVTFSFSKNQYVEDIFGDLYGEPRDLRISVMAFRDDELEEKQVFQFFVHQEIEAP